MVVITGASSGLGAALAKLYDRDGKTVYLTGRNRERLADVASGLSSKSKHCACDLSDPNAVESLFGLLEGVPQTIVHCAGSGYFGLLAEQDPQHIQSLIDNNLTSAIHVVREAVKRYQDEPVTLVMVMSTAAQVAKAEESTYCAVKWAVKGLIESVRLELKGKSMNIVAVYPGGMATEFWPNSGKMMDTSRFMSVQDAADMIYGAMSHLGNGHVSDITVNRT